jgi:DNA-binding MarR family transcriptional regulator
VLALRRLSYGDATMSSMSPLFDMTPVRVPARRGQASFGIARHRDPWPPRDRDDTDIALVAASILSASGRLRSRLRRTAREVGAELDVVMLLLLFSEATRWLQIVEVAELLGIDKGTASRLATRAEAAGLIDKLTSAIDGREVACRLSVAGRTAVTACLDLLRPHAIAVLRPTDREWVAEMRELLQPSARLDPSTHNSGWRAGVRTGMWPPV